MSRWSPSERIEAKLKIAKQKLKMAIILIEEVEEKIKDET